MPNPLPTTRTFSGRSARCAAVRWAFALLLLCIGWQAVLLPAQRTAGQAHFHRASQIALDDTAEHIDDQAHDHGHEVEDDQPLNAVTGAEGDVSTLQVTAPHHHSEIGHHDHADEARDVVYLDEGPAEPGSTLTHGLKRVAGDADGLLSAGPCRLGDAPACVAPTARLPSDASHIVSPMERPPRRTA